MGKIRSIDEHVDLKQKALKYLEKKDKEEKKKQNQSKNMVGNSLFKSEEEY